MYAVVLWMGFPIVAGLSKMPSTSFTVHHTVTSVGPYMFLSKVHTVETPRPHG
jgi:hypothetical protein